MRKLKNESGSALLLAIFLLVLVSIVMISFSTQVGNQVKSTMNLKNDIQEKYNEESKIEVNLAYFIQNINIEKYQNQEKNYNYYKLNYSGTVDNKYELIDITIGGNTVNTNGDIIIDLDTSGGDNSNKTPTPHCDINDLINFNIMFIGGNNERSNIKVKISNIVSDTNYKISYDILSWRNK